MDGGGWQEFYDAHKEVEQLRKFNAAIVMNRNKTDAEFKQIIGLLRECRKVLREIQCYDIDFYNRTCAGLIEAIDTHKVL